VAAGSSPAAIPQQKQTDKRRVNKCDAWIEDDDQEGMADVRERSFAAAGGAFVGGKV
jgi:hypothetical protein